MDNFKELLLLTILTSAAFVFGQNAISDEYYDYVEIKAGTFINECWNPETCSEIDGEVPFYFSIGRAYEFDNWTLGLEYLHRSNVDIGPPFNKADEEYNRDGVFLRVNYKFNRRKL